MAAIEDDTKWNRELALARAINELNNTLALTGERIELVVVATRVHDERRLSAPLPWLVVNTQAGPVKIHKRHG